MDRYKGVDDKYVVGKLCIFVGGSCFAVRFQTAMLHIPKFIEICNTIVMCCVATRLQVDRSSVSETLHPDIVTQSKSEVRK